jgi:hypothetical protein
MISTRRAREADLDKLISVADGAIYAGTAANSREELAPSTGEVTCARAHLRAVRAMLQTHTLPQRPKDPR